MSLWADVPKKQGVHRFIMKLGINQRRKVTQITSLNADRWLRWLAETQSRSLIKDMFIPVTNQNYSVNNLQNLLGFEAENNVKCSDLISLDTKWKCDLV